MPYPKCLTSFSPTSRTLPIASTPAFGYRKISLPGNLQAIPSMRSSRTARLRPGSRHDYQYRGTTALEPEVRFKKPESTSGLAGPAGRREAVTMDIRSILASLADIDGESNPSLAPLLLIQILCDIAPLPT